MAFRLYFWYNQPNMFIKISSLTLAIFMFFVLFGSRQHPYMFAAAVFGLILATLAINFKRLNFTWPHLLLPILYILAAAGVFALIPNPAWQIMFLVLSSVLFFLMEIRLGKESHLLQNIYLLSAFGLFLSLFASEFYFRMPLYYFVPAVFVVSFILAIQGFTGFVLPAKKYFYLLLSLACAEAAWGLAYWPTHFFVGAVVLFCVFYILWLFSFSAFFGKLSRAKIFWQLSLVGIILMVTLATAAWKPLS